MRQITFEIWVPSFLWMLAQCIHRNMPRLYDVQRGCKLLQSAQMSVQMGESVL
jgi:hypothetical protein